jgi:hypothetical protein
MRHALLAPEGPVAVPPTVCGVQQELGTSRQLADELAALRAQVAELLPVLVGVDGWLWASRREILPDVGEEPLLLSARRTSVIHGPKPTGPTTEERL